ncbi:pupal cuticle protein Edg-91 [Drosophila nasuta]|uniref:pupal cuticle protein Edg-91 n=1 Tax=Drosophila nasuta TaxID=42062 RepID=UPI00295E8793|nr:pupal cuticle protein Edg-91 [Drosophila nasuta]
MALCLLEDMEEATTPRLEQVQVLQRAAAVATMDMALGIQDTAMDGQAQDMVEDLEEAMERRPQNLFLLLGICLVFLLNEANAGKLKLLAFKGPHGGFVKVKARTPKLLGLKAGLIGGALGAGLGGGISGGFGGGVNVGGGFGGYGGHSSGYEHHEEHHESHYSSGGSYGGGSYGGGGFGGGGFGGGGLWGK